MSAFPGLERGSLAPGVLSTAVVVLALVLMAAVFAPVLYAEYALRRHGAVVGSRPTQPVAGSWFDGYFVVERIDEQTYAIGEPRYYQANYSYLIVGTTRALLFDAGTGQRDLVPVVRSLTGLPVTVAPSHLHFDHVGALGRFERTALLNVEGLRARAKDGVLTLARYEFLGFADGLPPRRVAIDEWLHPGQVVDLGGRRLEVLHTPGHTPTSVSVYDADRGILFCGDFVYPGNLYGFVPGASRGAYRRTTEQLIARLPPSTRLYAAHPADEAPVISAPRLSVSDLHDLARLLAGIDAGTARPTGFFPRTFVVSHDLQFQTGFSWNNK